VQVVNQTKLTRLKVVKSFLGKCINNGWLKANFWNTINVKVDKKVKKGAKPNDIANLISLFDKSAFIVCLELQYNFNGYTELLFGSYRSYK